MPRAPIRRLRGRLAIAAGLLAACGTAAAQSVAADAPREAVDPWALSALYTHSNLSGASDDWQQLDLDAYFRAGPRWALTGGVDYRRRADTTDVVYGIGAEFYPNAAWQIHASLATTPDADFTYEHGYAVGADWRVTPWLSLLLEARGFEFEDGDLQEWRPGVTVWFNDDATALTARYTDGDAFDLVGYHAWSLRLDHGFSSGHRLSLGYAHGIDPERDPAVPGVLLSEADYYSVFYRFPLRTGSGAAASTLDLILGADYEDRRDAYTRTGISIGLAARF
jgi:YaiO family outer membrane protein